MNSDFKPNLDKHRRAPQREISEDYVETNIAQKIDQDRQAISGSSTYARMADFHRVVPRDMANNRLLNVVVKHMEVEGHDIQQFSPFNMMDETRVKLFGKDLVGEVQFDDVVIQLVALDGKFAKAQVYGELPDFISDPTSGHWSGPHRLAEHLYMKTQQHYANKRNKPQVVPKDYNTAIRAQNYDMAWTYLQNGLSALRQHAAGMQKLTQDEIKEVVRMLNSASNAPRLHMHVAKVEGTPK